MSIRVIVRESHLLKHQAAALSDTIAAAAAAAAAANEVACYNLVQVAQSWLEELQASATVSQPSGVKATSAALVSVPDTAAAPAAASCALVVSDSGSSTNAVAILLDLWLQGQEIHAQYMVRSSSPPSLSPVTIHHCVSSYFLNPHRLPPPSPHILCASSDGVVRPAGDAAQPASCRASHCTPQAKHWQACAPILEKRGKIISGEDDGGEGGTLLLCGEENLRV